MPRFDNPDSLESNLNGLLAPDFSTHELEDFDNSDHSGRWGGGLITINRAVDVAPYADTVTLFTMLDWPTTQPNWKFAAMGGLMWSDMTWQAGPPSVLLGTLNDNDLILLAWNPPSGTRSAGAVRGLLDVHYNALFYQSYIIKWPDNIKVSWDGGGTGTLTGRITFTVWGYLIPDLERSSA